MAGFRFDLFKGIRPRISKRKLPGGEAQTAQNLKLGSGDLEPWPENTTVVAVDEPYVTRSIFLYENSNTGLQYWMQWGNYVDVARGPIKGDDLDRIYYTGDGPPKITWNELQFAPPFPSVGYELGVPKPLTRITAEGQELPETVPAALRRTSTDTPLSCPNFEIVDVDFTTYPGTGTPNDIWRVVSATATIVFDIQVGDLLKVEEVVDTDTVVFGSATGSGAAAATAKNDKTSSTYWKAMDEQGSTQLADFIGWRIPNNLYATIPGHLLRVGDIVRITRLDLSTGFRWPNPGTGTDLYELASDGTAGDWGTPTNDKHENVRLGLSADGLTHFDLNGGFYYDVDRTASDAAVLEDRTYVYTYVSSVGEEGPPSDPSTLVPALDGDSIVLTGFDLSPTGDRDIDRIRLYRTNSTSVGTEYQFVREVTFDQIQAEGSVTDSVEAADLGEIIQSTTWFPPPSNMEGIVSMPNGMMVGFFGKDIYFSEPYQPHAWPPEYDQAVDYPIVALAPFGNSVAILTKGTPYVITGAHPRNANVRPYKINQSCLFKESVATSGDKVYYTSPDGLVEIGVNGARVVTEPFARKTDWTPFEPETMVGAFYDGQYYGFWGADDTVLPQPTGSVAATGTLLTDTETFEEDIVAGGKTIILTLTGVTWVSAGTNFDAVRDDIINNITSDNNESTGWNAVRSQIASSSVVRTSDTVVTITLPAIPGYSVDDNETLTLRAPAVAISASNTLTAPETGFIIRDSIYSSEVVIASGPQTASDLPEFLVSRQNIDVWTEDDPASYFAAALTPDLQDVCYNPVLERWLAVGTYTTGAQAGDAIVLTSDNPKDDNSWFIRTVPAGPKGKASRCCIYDNTTDSFYVGGDDNQLMYSPNGLFWYIASVPPSLYLKDFKKFARAPSGNDGESPYLYAVFSDTKQVARSANLNTSPQNTVWQDLGSMTTSGTAMSSITSGNGLVYLANNNATAEVGYVPQGLTTYTKIGDLTMDVSDMVYGDGRLVVISANGRIQYVDCDDAGTELTIGNWSAVSSAIDGAGTRDLAKIEYDAGTDGRIGYGFVATLSATGAPGDYLVYTSPDAVTWTLRATQSNQADANGIGVRTPTQDLSGTAGATVTLTNFNYFQYGEGSVPVAKLIIRTDGTIDTQRDNNAPVQRNALTDWIFPNYFSDSLYEFRVTNVVTVSGSAVWQTSPGADGTWFNMSTDRTWAVQGNTRRFDLEVRYNGGAVLDACTITLGSSVYIYDDFDDRYYYWRSSDNIQLR